MRSIERPNPGIGAKSHPGSVVGNVAIVSPDNGRLAIESGLNPEDHPEVRLYDMNSGKGIAQIELAQ